MAEKKTETEKKEKKKTAKAEKKEIKKTVKKTVKKILKETKKAVKAKKADANPETDKLVDLIEKTLSAGKAADVVVLDLRGKSSLADYLVIATGRSARHAVALAEQVQLRLKKTGCPATLEGEEKGEWVIVDAGDVITHVFVPEARQLYCIEELWGAETPRGESGK